MIFNAKRIFACCIILVCLNICCFGQIKAGAAKLTVTKKIDLRILYVGHPATERQKDFTQFLNKYFKQVQTGDLKEFSEDQANGFDVVILDYDGDGFKSPRPQLSRQYARPTVTVGVTGAFICSQMRLKTGYL